MKKIFGLILILNIIVGQTPKYDSPFLTDDIRASIKQLIKYNDIAINVEDDDARIDFYKAVSEAFYISTNKLEELYSKKTEEKYSHIQKLEANYSLEIVLPEDNKPVFTYEYKPIKITQKAKDKNIHEKQAKKMKVQYVKLYSYFKDLNNALESTISDLESDIANLEAQKEEDAQIEVNEEQEEVSPNNIQLDTTTVIHSEVVEAEPDKAITIVSEETDTNEEIVKKEVTVADIPPIVEEVVDTTPSHCNIGLQMSDEKENSLQVVYDCSEPIYGFQFELTNVVLKSSDNPIFDIRFSENTGQVLGFSLKGESMQKGQGLLVEFEYEAPEEDSEICMQDEVIAGKSGSQILVEKGPCLIIKGSGVPIPVIEEVVIEEATVEVIPQKTKETVQVNSQDSEISNFQNAFRNARNSGNETFEFEGLTYSTLTRQDFRRAFRNARAQGKPTFRFGNRTYSTKIKEEAE
jgi:hypothetical protein